MSQQINLLNPALRERRDWLRFEAVAPVALLCLAAMVAGAVYLHRQQTALSQEETALTARVKAAQDRLQAISRAVGDRKANPALAVEAERLAATVQRRQQALDTLTGQAAGDHRYSEVMRGLARQSMNGLWLTGFAAGGETLEIRGRMTEAALLPDYIRRLNDESAFQGRRFDTLDMKEIKPPTATAAEGAAARQAAPVLPRHVEFALVAGAAEKPAGGARP